jgi:hypothetical protein
MIIEGHTMKLRRRHFLHLAACAAALPSLSCIARAQQAYPTRPVTMIVPFAAGGPRTSGASGRSPCW